MKSQNRLTAFTIGCALGVFLAPLFSSTAFSTTARIVNAFTGDALPSTATLRVVRNREGVTHVIEFVEGEPRPVTPSNLRLRYAGGLQLNPRMITICVGDSVEFKNNWKAKVNVFSYSKALKFDVGRFKPGESRTVGPFPEPGLVRLYDEIHSHIKGFINVVDCSLKGREQSIKDGQKEIRASLEAAGEYVGEDNRTEDSSNKTGTSTDKVNASVHQANGLSIATFDTLYGRVRVNLPDDMRAGDTISGTVVAEPRGNTEEERSENLAELRGLVVEIQGEEQPGSPSVQDSAKLKPPQATTYGPAQTIIFLTPEEAVGDKRVQDPSARESYVFSSGNGYAGNFTLGPFGEYPLVLKVSLKKAPPAAKPPAQVQRQTGAASSSWPVIASTIVPTVEMHVTTPLNDRGFDFPAIGQQGREVEIFGPFDGNASNTTLMYGPAQSTVQDFEKNTENVSGGFGLLRPLAESPRKIVFEFPTNVTGPMGIMVKERDNVATGTARNVGVNLSAPKTNLMRGEKTIVTIEVSGLAGIIKDVPLQLDSKGVITMEGGNFQNLRIKPSEVTPEGRYTTNRAITGVQAGGFSVTATVIVRPFDLCLQDDSDPNRIFHFNSFTGDYIFACDGGSCRGGTGGTSAQPPTGSSVPPPPITLTGTGKPQMKGCIITLSHNAPDRRVFARLDACTKSGDASVETTSPKTNFNITDKNTADNTAASPPK